MTTIISTKTFIQRHLPDVAAIVAITAVFLFLTQWWSGLDTPDSEFYASLAIFTDDVTDRAYEDSYFWTRLGYIAPAHLLISLLGVWAGFAAFKALLLLIITTSVFTIARAATGFWRATWLTAAATSSSVLLAYLGNPYLTGTVLSGTAATIALSLRTSMPRMFTSGIVLGWLAMAYPSGALLAGTIWLALFIYNRQTGHITIKQAIVFLLIVAATTLAMIIAFIAIGTVLFPGLDWFGTYIEWSSFDHSVYSSGESVWLRDISLLVPLAALVLSIANRIRNTGSQAADTALIIMASAIGFFLTYALFHGEQFLEAPMLQAMLWPPALIAVVLVGASRMPDIPQRTPAHVAIAIVGLAAVIGAGRIDPNLPFAIGVILAVVLTVIAIATPRRTLATIVALTVFLTGAQLLQNSRTTLSSFFLEPYVWAYQANPNEAKLRAAVNAQQWLIDNTSRDDRMLLWVGGQWVDGDRELYTVAAMQLWGAGENLITLAPTLDDELGQDRLARIKPDVIAMYGSSMDAVLAFWSSIPAANSPSPPQCYDFEWPIDPESTFPLVNGYVCITRLTWNS